MRSAKLERLIYISDLHSGESNTIGALLVAIAVTRLTEAGLDILKDYLASEPELTLDLLQKFFNG